MTVCVMRVCVSVCTCLFPLVLISLLAAVVSVSLIFLNADVDPCVHTCSVSVATTPRWDAYVRTDNVTYTGNLLGWV